MVALLIAPANKPAMDTQHYDVVIIGAGAAGLMCAIEAGKRGRRVAILEKAAKPGRKILISGGGRCNFTNLYATAENYLSGNPHFCKSALSRFTQWDFIAMMDQAEIGWHEKTLGQLFCDEKAPAVVNMLLEHARAHGVEIFPHTEVEKVSRTTSFDMRTQQGNFHAASLVIATGGPSIPKMGSTDFGLRIASQFGLKNIPFRPALVPFTFEQTTIDALFKDISGLATEAIVSCNQQSFRENILFTHRGLSGPAILQISSYWRKGDTIKVNLLPDLDAETWLLQCKEEMPRKQLGTLLATHLPKRLVEKLIHNLQWPDTAVDQISDKSLRKIAATLNQWTLQPSGTEGMRTAEVCIGGVDTDELSSKTMESKTVSGLYFIGETVDVTGHLGGFNFQWAWASGWCAGQFV